MNIAELEAMVLVQGRQLAALQSEISALKANQGVRKVVAQAIAPTQQAEPEGARIFYPIECAKIAMPTTVELKKLLDMVFKAYPTLCTYSTSERFGHQDAADYFREFCAAFAYVAHKGRADHVDEKYSTGWWTFEASEWCRLQNNPVTISTSPLLAAVIAAGDVKFVQRDEWGNVWAFGLATYGGDRATESWRGVLKGKLLQPLPGVHKAPAGGSPNVRFEHSAG